MPSRYYIDGYNVIHFCPHMQSLANRDFEAARDALVDIAARFSATTGKQVTVVFDGRGRARNASKPPCGTPGVQVVYSPGHQSADSVIERYVYQASNRLDVVVVSADAGIRDFCRSLGAVVIPPESFLGIARDALDRARSDLQHKARTSTRNLLEDRLDERSRSHLRKVRKDLED